MSWNSMLKTAAAALAVATVAAAVPGAAFAQDHNNQSWNNDQERHNGQSWNNNQDRRNGQSWNNNDDRRNYQNGRGNWGAERQNTKNEWRNLAIAAGGATAYGLIRHDPTIAFVGAAGTLYSLDRYNQDRSSQDRGARVRATFFSQPYFYRDGARYDRRTVWNNGHQYYRFVRR